MVKHRLLLLLALPFILSSCGSKYEFSYIDKTKVVDNLDNVVEKPQILVNLDGDHWNKYLNELANKDDLNEEDLKEIVHWYTNTDITDLLFNILDQSSNTKTDVMSFRGDMYTDGVEGSKPIDYSFFEWNYKIIKEKNIDVFDVWIKECKANNINPWLTIRMNDRHESEKEASIFRGDIFYKAKANGWMIGKEYGGFSTCFNYEVKEIRAIFLAYIEEQLLHYDVYGLELDFLREIYCFDYLHKDRDYMCGIMNNFIGEVNVAKSKAEEKWGHKIKLSTRLPRDIEQAAAFGFDVISWNNERLVDSITISPREICDSAMPIAEWKEKLPNIDINAGLESNVCTTGGESHATREIVNGYAAQYLTAGANGIYLFNYYKTSEKSLRSDEVFNSLKSTNDIINSSRRHLVSRQDIAPEKYEPYDPLPLKANLFKNAEIRVETGLIPSGKKASVVIGINREISQKFTGILNNFELLYKGTTTIHGSSGGDLITDNPFAPKGTHFYLFESNNSSFENNVQTLSFSCNHLFNTNVEYIEIIVE